MDMNQYLDVFIEESREHLQTCNEKLLELEKIRQTCSLSMIFSERLIL